MAVRDRPLERTWLGFIGVNYVRPEAAELPQGEVEIGWWLTASVWGRGLATEGALALRDEAFGRLGLDRPLARHLATNGRSGASWRRSGCGSPAR